MADETIPTDAAAAEPAKAKKLKAWPRDFDPKKAPHDDKLEVHHSDEVWAKLHGDDLPAHAFRVEKSCRCCGARVFTIHGENTTVCLGCGRVL